MKVFDQWLKLFLGMRGLPSACLELIKAEGRWRYAQRRYSGVVFGRGVVVDNFCEFGKHVKVYRNSVLSSVSIGDYSYIGGDSILKNCTLGKFCTVAPEVRIGLGVHPVTDVISTYPGFYSASASGVKRFNIDSSVVESKDILIGNDVWIGQRSIVLDGVSIGDGAVIAAGSVVTRDVSNYTVAGGVPAKTIKVRFSQADIEKLIAFQWWNKSSDFLSKHGTLMLDPDRFMELIDSIDDSHNMDEDT